jgi:hypothetical protein
VPAIQRDDGEKKGSRVAKGSASVGGLDEASFRRSAGGTNKTDDREASTFLTQIDP